MRNPQDAPNLIVVLLTVAAVIFCVFFLPVIVVFGLPVLIFLLFTGSLGTAIGLGINYVLFGNKQ
jgi:hypothetical protein